MFLYPALLAGFAFVGVPLLVHLINMLRHRRQRWAAMDFLLASYRKQKKWLRLRQLLLLLTRLAVAAVLVAMLCGWTGGRQLLGVLGGQTTHHIVVLDDSYSMGDASGGGETTSYDRALSSLQRLTQRLAGSEGSHQLTVMRASRAALAVQAGSESGDAAADLSSQTITGDSGLIARVMATSASALRTDLVAALDLAAELATGATADESFLYVASDFRSRDWESPERLAESLRAFTSPGLKVRMIDCAERPDRNLAVTDLFPVQDVWVAGVPVVVRATVKNYSATDVKNVTLACRVIRYGDEVSEVDPSRPISGVVDSLPALVIESLAPGAEVTKSFQVFINETGTHAIEVELPSDALAVDNKRSCTLPLSDAERVLVIDSDPDEMGAYTIAAVLDPGSQVRIGAVPDIKPPAFLRSATPEMLAPYRAIYLIDLPDLTDAAADSLNQYVRNGGGLAWFLGKEVRAESYNRALLSQDRRLLPAPLESIDDLGTGGTADAGDVVFADRDTLMEPLRSAGDATLSLIGVARSWTLRPQSEDELESDAESGENPYRYSTVLARRDGNPLVVEHDLGSGTVITVLTSLDVGWTNWAGDPTFVPFMLLANARLWSGASASTARTVAEPLERTFSNRDFFPELKLLTPSNTPPRVVMEMTALAPDDTNEELVTVNLDPVEKLISGDADLDELLRPGIFEWGLLRADGGGSVLPSASTIIVGEGDLRRADAAEIRRDLLPMDVQFVSSSNWNQQTEVAGSSRLGIALLALLGLLLAAEQALAYWASYHARGESAASGHDLSASRPAFGLNAGGRQG